jgi:hypothetical protein
VVDETALTTILGCNVAATKRRQKAAVIGEYCGAQLGGEGRFAGGWLRDDALGPAPKQACESIFASHTSGQTQAVAQPIARAVVLAAADSATALASVRSPDEGAKQRSTSADLEENALVLHVAV